MAILAIIKKVALKHNKTKKKKVDNGFNINSNNYRYS